jgi:signal transduction histidine kinase/purine-cytosine permease-like protein
VPLPARARRCALPAVAPARLSATYFRGIGMDTRLAPGIPTDAPVIRVKREYQSWVANETLEDYALRYAARSYRRWSPFVVANTAIGGISFLALEAIGGSITISYGFQNALPAIVIVSLLILLISVPIAYYSATANVDIDLLTRGAGFGFIGSTIPSLIYASFTFIFFALEAAIMAQALELALGLNIVIGYLVSSLVIIPLAFFGVTLINRLQLWTQPFWVVLLILPFVFILYRDPGVFAAWSSYYGHGQPHGEFNVLLFGAATGVLFSLVVQIGEQADYLRFLPERTAANRRAWWVALLGAGPGWILLGGLKIAAGSLLAFIAIRAGSTPSEAVQPMHMYVKAYGYVFEDPRVVLAVAAFFVVLSQIKINVTNAYGGSLAWSNFFARFAHYHPGRVVWLVFNVMIALLLQLMGIFATLEAVLSVYSSVAIAWIGALVADLVVLKPLGVSPSYIEFKRAHLYNFNPVGCGAMLIASVVSISAYAGAFGELARAYFVFIALATSFASAIAIAFATRGRYYIARPDVHFRHRAGDAPVRCSICERDYEPRDMAYCPFYRGAICSLCCGLENHCHDFCKRRAPASAAQTARVAEVTPFKPHLGRRIGRFLGLFSLSAAVTGAVFVLAYRLMEVDPLVAGDVIDILIRLYAATMLVLAVGTWWIVLSHERSELTAAELLHSLQNLENTRRDLVESEKMASLGGLVAGVAHEINTPVGIAVSTASYLHDRTEEIRRKLGSGELSAEELDHYLNDASQSARLLLSNANRAAQLVQSFKQVAVDQISDERRRFDLRAYVDETLLNLRPKLKQSRVVVRIDGPNGIAMDSYPGPLAQVITNLVVNSLQHGFDAASGGSIAIAFQAAGDQNVLIRYEDDGRGIPAAHRERVFDPFFTTRRGAGGSGLGLYLVYNIVTRKLGGSIAVEERASRRGTAFVIRLPRVAYASPEAVHVMRAMPRKDA